MARRVLNSQRNMRVSETKETTYSFILPGITSLTPDQQSAVNNPEPISLSGGAGTGKTVVSIYKHLNNIEILNNTSMLITYTKTLGFYIKMSL